MQPIKTVIMAGGKGTRIAQDWPLLPKPMVPLCGKPILQHQIELLVRQGLCDITLVVGHMADKITAHFGDGAQYGARIGYVVEQAPLGTAGALALVPRQDILLLMGDVFLEVDFSRFLSWHREKQADITLFAHPNSHPWDSDLLVARPTGQVQRWASKKDAERGELRNLVNAGLYILSAHVLPTQAAPLDLDKGVVAPRIAGGGVYAYRSSEYVKDMGTPERLAAVCRDIENGVCAARALNNRQRAVFLDRDGVINRHEGFVTQPQQLALLPGAAEGIHRLNTSPFLAICVTNQPVVARGDVSFEGLEHIHARLDTLLAQAAGAYLDDLFFCPHHPHKGFEGEVPALKIDCDCRKPKPGLLLAAAEKYNIDLARSYMIGDAAADIEAGKAAGCTSIGISWDEAPGELLRAAAPSAVFPSLAAAVDAVLARRV